MKYKLPLVERELVCVSVKEYIAIVISWLWLVGLPISTYAFEFMLRSIVECIMPYT